MSIVHYPCELLLDQGHYVGDDPIGHKCIAPAEFEWNGVAVCRSCKTILETQPERVTIPVFESTLAERQAEWKAWAQSLVETIGAKQ